MSGLRRVKLSGRSYSNSRALKSYTSAYHCSVVSSGGALKSKAIGSQDMVNPMVEFSFFKVMKLKTRMAAKMAAKMAAWMVNTTWMLFHIMLRCKPPFA
jgi:hypothetical protein